MISIGNELESLERYVRERDLALDSYIAGIRNVAEYTIDLDQASGDTHRKYLRALADEVAGGQAIVLSKSQANLRGLLRDFRDKSMQYVKALRMQLVDTAEAFQEILTTLSQSDGDQQDQVQAVVTRLR